MVNALAPRPCSPSLVDELKALAIPGVRDYTIIGPPGRCEGVLAWSSSAPAGTYEEASPSAAQTTQIRNAIAAHVPAPPAGKVLLHQLRADLPNVDTMTVAELRVYVRRLARLTLAAVAEVAEQREA